MDYKIDTQKGLVGLLSAGRLVHIHCFLIRADICLKMFWLQVSYTTVYRHSGSNTNWDWVSKHSKYSQGLKHTKDFSLRR